MMIEDSEQYKRGCNQMAALEQRLKDTSPYEQATIYCGIVREIDGLNINLADWEELSGYGPVLFNLSECLKKHAQIGDNGQYAMAHNQFRSLARELKHTKENTTRHKALLCVMESLACAIEEYEELFEDKPWYQKD